MSKRLLAVICALVATLATALWLGGLVQLLMSVQTIFARDRDVAVQAAPMLFDVFQWYQLILGGVGLMAAIGYAWTARRRGWIAVAGLAIALASAVWLAMSIMPAIAAASPGSEEFGRLHGLSMVSYLIAFGGALTAMIALLPPMRP